MVEEALRLGPNVMVAAALEHWSQLALIDDVASHQGVDANVTPLVLTHVYRYWSRAT